MVTTYLLPQNDDMKEIYNPVVILQDEECFLPWTDYRGMLSDHIKCSIILEGEEARLVVGKEKGNKP